MSDSSALTPPSRYAAPSTVSEPPPSLLADARHDHENYLQLAQQADALWETVRKEDSAVTAHEAASAAHEAAQLAARHNAPSNYMKSSATCRRRRSPKTTPWPAR